MEGLAIFVSLAAGIERLQETTLGKRLSGIWMQIVSWVVGIIVCVLLKVGLFKMLGMIDTADIVRTYGDFVISGFIVGLGSNFLHDVFPGLSSNTPAAKQ